MFIIENYSNVTFELTIQWNPALGPPLYYGYFVIKVTVFSLKQKLSRSLSYLRNPFNMANPLIWPDVLGSLVTELTGFHRSYMCSYNCAHV